MSTVLTIGVAAELAEQFTAAGATATHLGAGALDADGGLLARLEEAGAPQVLVLGTDVPLPHALDLAAQVDVSRAGTSVVVVGPSDPDLWVAAMRSGVRDVLHPHAGVDEVAAVLRRCADRARALATTAEPDADHRVVVVGSAKGGVGKTTVATNLALGLARSGVGSTVVIDLDTQFGDVASALALVPEYTLPDTVHGATGDDPLLLKTFLSRHPSGLYVVAGSDSPAAGDAVTPEQVGRLVHALRQEFAYVVLDTAPGLSDHTLTVLEEATDLVLLCGADVPGVRGLRKELDVLTELDLVPARRHLLLNMWDADGGLSMKDIETTIGAPLDVVLPRSAAVPLSTNTGVPLLQSGGRDPVAKGLQALLGRIQPEAAPARTGLFGRLKAGAR